MRWPELDLSDARTWTIPAARMKASRDHRVPLTQTMVALLTGLERHSKTDLVFFSSKGKALSDMTLSAAMKRIHAADIKSGGPGYVDDRTGRPAVPHGLRSTFRDWAAECGYERDMAELQLSHVVGSEVERAYRRSDMLERRRAMMEAWEQALQGVRPDTIVPFGAVQ
jgi:integrase